MIVARPSLTHPDRGARRPKQASASRALQWSSEVESGQLAIERVTDRRR